jgi:hypothetical protein
MKKRIALLPLLIAVHLLAVATTSADPRMETNKDFCHFILDPNNTDNEVFVAACGSVITIVEKIATAGTVKIKCEENNRIASGYATVTKVVRQSASPIPPGATVLFTNADSGTPCTMVESNGRAYTSTKWQSAIKAGTATKKGLVTLQYELLCQEGEQL